MSAGVFSLVGYEADYGTGTAIHPIKVQPETEDLIINGEGNGGALPAAITNQISCQVSKSRRSLGLHARQVSVRFTGAIPTNYAANQTYRIPLLNKLIAAQATKGQTGTYLSLPIVVVENFSPEVVR